MLTNYDGQDITYDEIGNPIKVGSTELTWVGRQLMQMKNGDEVISYAYNGDGQRVSKTVNGTTTEYFYNGEILAGQKTGDDVIVFMYDNNGDTFGFIYNGTEYYYIKNAQNDVTAIASADGTVIANCYYDAWGYPEDITGNTEIANLNPLRYRSYYYDTESELYCLNTRYYSAEIGRFINADGYEVINADHENMVQYNLYNYCFNNPITFSDDTGDWPEWAINLTKVAIGAVAIGIGVAATVATGGAAVPVLVASVKIAVASAAVGAAVGAGIGAVEHRITTGSWKGAGKSVLKSAVSGAADGFMWGGISAGLSFTTVALKGIKVQQIGRLNAANKSGNGYLGVKYQVKKTNGRFTTRSIELHSPHKSGPHNVWHWQQNTWHNNGILNGPTSFVKPSKHWTLLWRRF